MFEKASWLNNGEASEMMRSDKLEMGLLRAIARTNAGEWVELSFGDPSAQRRACGLLAHAVSSFR